MNDATVIRVDHVSKKFSKSLKRSMLFGISDIGRNLCGLRSKSGELRESEFWAVDDVSFELKKGEAVGLIGPNGSGKSTILKMLNGIFWPDKGKITVRGRVGALIEVGAGFHPMLTGRENIYVNAAILGMAKCEVEKNISKIIEFADIGDFIDAPVRSYSSGMYVKLGFAVAAHCEPDLLLVDEALAVGDSAFRHKCFEKMNRIKTEKQASIIYVSHDILTVERFCDRGIFLNNGKISTEGEIHEVISDYQFFANEMIKRQQGGEFPAGVPYCTKEIEIADVKFLNREGYEQGVFEYDQTLRVRISYKAKAVVLGPRVEIQIRGSDGKLVSTFGPHFEDLEISRINKGNGIIECRIERIPLLSNRYSVDIGLYDKTRTILIDWWSGNTNPTLSFCVLPNRISQMMGQYTPVCHSMNTWTVNGCQLDANCEEHL